MGGRGCFRSPFSNETIFQIGELYVKAPGAVILRKLPKCLCLVECRQSWKIQKKWGHLKQMISLKKSQDLMVAGKEAKATQTSTSKVGQWSIWELWEDLQPTITYIQSSICFKKSSPSHAMKKKDIAIKEHVYIYIWSKGEEWNPFNCSFWSLCCYLGNFTIFYILQVPCLYMGFT